LTESSVGLTTRNPAFAYARATASRLAAVREKPCCNHTIAEGSPGGKYHRAATRTGLPAHSVAMSDDDTAAGAAVTADGATPTNTTIAATTAMHQRNNPPDIRQV